MSKEALLVVDAPSVLFRAYYALPDTIRGRGGMPVNALLGSANMMLRTVEDFEPRAVVMCFGQDAADYRTELLDAYHADREEIEEDLGDQFDEAWDFFESFGWYCDIEPGFEADDLLGSYALAEQARRGRTLILTGDRDLYQCANRSCTVLYLKTGTKGVEIVDPSEVEHRYGIPPKLVPDFIALRGDPSDGIPGAPGVGPKIAADLLVRHGSLERAIERADEERPRVRDSLEANASRLMSYKDIATLREIDVEPPGNRDTDYESGARAAAELGMNQLAGRLGELAARKP